MPCMECQTLQLTWASADTAGHEDTELMTSEAFKLISNLQWYFRH